MITIAVSICAFLFLFHPVAVQYIVDLQVGGLGPELGPDSKYNL